MPDRGNDMSRRFDVIIAGGGIVGAALACALGQGGLRVAVIESREPQPFTPDQDYGLRASALSIASQHILENLGVWQQLQGWRISPYEKMSVWDAGGAGKIEFDAAEAGEPALGHIIENALIQRALFEASEQNIKWFCPASLQGFVVDKDEVIVTLDTGEVLLSQLIVGADGANSKVRELAGIQFQSRDYNQQGIVANVGTQLAHERTARQRFLPDGILAFLPLADGRCSIVWSSDKTRAEYLMDLNDDAFRTELGETFDHVLGEITSLSRRAAFPLKGRHAETYIKPRVTLVGDAAHTIHPLAGQGVNLGFLDIAELSSHLLNTERDLGSLHLLRKYERARAGENELMLRAMEGFKLLFNNKNPVLGWMRNTGLSVTNQVNPLKQLFMYQAMGESANLPLLTRPFFSDKK